MRAVLDTNILISAFVFPGGAPESVFRLAVERRLELVTSPALLAEFGRALADTFGWEPSMAGTAVAQVLRIGAVARPSTTLNVVADDPADDRMLEAAHEGGADIVVSGDRHLQRLGRWEDVRIVTAPNLLAELGVTSGDG